MQRLTYIIAAIALTATTQHLTQLWTWSPILAAPMLPKWATNTAALATAAASIALADSLTPLHFATALAVGTVYG